MNLFKKINFKKTFLVLLAMFMVLTILQPFSVFGASSGDKITIFSEDDALVYKLKHNGTSVGTSDAWYTTDGKNYPAYCLDPQKPGVGERGGLYDVTIANTNITNPKIHGIILAGYPYKTFTELGLPNAWEAAFATKFALKIYLENKSGHRDISGWSPVNSDNQYMYDAIMKIYNEGIKNTTIPPVPSVTVTPTGGTTMTEQEIDGETYYIKEYTVTSNVQIKSYTVSITGTKPSGTKIVDLSNEEKTSFSAGEKFKVIILKEGISNSGSITLDVKG